jgi:hypothetical protein
MNARMEPELISVPVNVGSENPAIPRNEVSSSYYEIHVTFSHVIEDQDIIDARIVESRRGDPCLPVEVVFSNLGIPLQ